MVAVVTEHWLDTWSLDIGRGHPGGALGAAGWLGEVTRGEQNPAPWIRAALGAMSLSWPSAPRPVASRGEDGGGSPEALPGPGPQGTGDRPGRPRRGSARGADLTSLPGSSEEDGEAGSRAGSPAESERTSDTSSSSEPGPPRGPASRRVVVSSQEPSGGPKGLAPPVRPD